MNKKCLLFSCMLSLALGTTKAQTMTALTAAGTLVQITDAAMPGTIGTPVTLTGVTGGQSIVGIDYRPNTGELYALGYNSSLSSGNAQLYVLNPVTGAATPVGSSITLSLGSGGIGFDFNPTVDRIRVVGENGANYRLHPVTGAVAATDGMLAYNATDPNAGKTPAIVACAYTNSYIGSEATTLFNYDKTLNILTSQVPPNNGTQNTIGGSGIAVATSGSNVGMDIYMDPATKTNMAYLSATVGGVNNLYRINTATGAATLLGAIGTGTVAIREVAVKIDRTVPATYTGQLLYGITKVNRNLVKFSSDNPELIRELLPVTGIAAGQVLVGMDVRPADLQLYALGYHDTTRTYQLYQINTTTGAATAVGTPGTMNLGMGEKIGFDFNPTVDRIRIVSTNDSNFRLNPLTGAIAATDTSLSYRSADVNFGSNPTVSSVAYTNSYKMATTTALFGVDDNLGAFVGIVPPNQGFLNTLASGIVTFNPSDLTNDLDFYYDSASASNIGYLAANTGSAVNDVLYTISPSGTVAMADTIGLGVQLYDIAAQLTYTGPSTGISALGSTNVFEVYPVPVSDILHVRLSAQNTERRMLSITDLAGRQVKVQDVAPNSNTLIIRVNDLPSGTYILSLYGTSGAVTFVKN